jgi:Papain family cysteine protease
MAKKKRPAAKKSTGKATARRRTRQTIAPSRRICNLVPSTGIENDWKYEDALGTGVLGAVAALPPSKDLRADWWKIEDQEDTGSCVGWGTAEGVVRYHMVAAGKLSKNEPLSPRYVWMASKETDEFIGHPSSFIEGDGTSLKAAVDVCRKYGVVTEDVLPFHIATKMYKGSDSSFYAIAAQRRISSYFNLGKNLNQWKSWLVSNGPILVALNVDHTWDSAADTHGNLDTFMPNTIRGGHAVSVVGYTATGRFIVRNSWGIHWGDKGFAYATPAYIMAGFFDESYGVTV